MDQTIKVWEASTGTCQSTLTGHRYVPFPCIECFLSYFGTDLVFLSSGTVTSVAYSPCGKWIVSGSIDHTIKVWEASTGTCQSMLTGHAGPVTQVEFIDADTVVSSSDDGTTRAWDVATGTQKAEFEGEKFTFTKSSGGEEQTVGAYVVTKKDNMVLVHQTHALKHNEPTAENSHAVAFFRAPGVVRTLDCAGDRIAVGCLNGEVLHLQAAWLVDS